MGRPLTPSRGGEGIKCLDLCCVMSSAFALIVINCFVIDASRLCKVFAEKLRGEGSGWPLDCRTTQAELRGMHSDDISDWLDVQLIAKRTEVISRLVYLPFIVLTIMIISRLTIFDRLGFSPPLIITFLLLAVCSAASALILRSAAEKTREDAIANLRKKRLQLTNGSTATGSTNSTGHTAERLSQVAQLIEEIEAEKRGAFAPFSEQPVVRALFLQTGGLGLWTVLERLSLFPWS